MASRYSSNNPSHETGRPDGHRWRASVARLAIAALGGALLWGCATVRPEDKEFLADPAMTYGADGDLMAHDEHVFSNREGSFGGGSVSGGGCGCN